MVFKQARDVYKRQAYIIAKDIIHLILCLQELIDNDPEVSPYFKVIMLENYNVSKAAKRCV